MLRGLFPFFTVGLRTVKSVCDRIRRDFVFVKDLAKTVIKAIDGQGNGTYHFSSGKDVSIIDLYNSVVKSMKLEIYPEPEIKKLGKDDVSRYYLTLKDI